MAIKKAVAIYNGRVKALGSGDMPDSITSVAYSSWGTETTKSPKASDVKSKIDSITNATSGIIAKDLGATSGTQVFAHNMSTAPSRVILTFKYGSSNGTTDESYGVFDSSGNKCVYVAGNATMFGGSWTTKSAYIEVGGGGSQSGVISVDSTNITITWTKAGTISGTAYGLWEAFAI